MNAHGRNVLESCCSVLESSSGNNSGLKTSLFKLSQRTRSSDLTCVEHITHLANVEMKRSNLNWDLTCVC
jgi:hypothetical protein